MYVKILKKSHKNIKTIKIKKYKYTYIFPKLWQPWRTRNSAQKRGILPHGGPRRKSISRNTYKISLKQVKLTTIQ